MKLFLELIYSLVVITAVYLSYKYHLPSLIYKVPLKEVNFVSNKIKNSGKRIDTFSCGGTVSGVYISKGSLRMEIYDGGIWLKPVLTIPFGIEKTDILNVKLEKKRNDFILTIDHSSSIILSPLVINLGYGDFSELLYLLK